MNYKKIVITALLIILSAYFIPISYLQVLTVLALITVLFMEFRKGDE